MKMYKKLLTLLSIITVMALLFAACRGATPAAPPAADPGPAEVETPADDPPAQEDDPVDEAEEAADLVEITIPHFKVGDNVGAQYFLPQIERFNERYAGRFRINIEGIPQHLYMDQIKQLAAQRMLPAIVYGVDDNLWFREVVLAGNLFHDLSAFYDTHPEFVSWLHPDTIRYNTHDDGRMLTIPMPIQRPIGMFYNSYLWEPSRPIHDMTWREVAADLGGNTIAFMTGENAWTTGLALAALIAAEPGGAELLVRYVQNEEWITDFNHPALIGAFTELQYLLMNHAQPGAVGAPYAEAANSFFNLGSAIICNGPWMIGDITDGQDSWWGEGFNPDTVRGTILPGNVAVGNTFGYGYWVPATASPEEVELAMAYFSFIAQPEELEWRMIIAGGTIPGFEYSQQFLSDLQDHRLMYEWLNAIDGNTTIVPGIWGAMVPSVANHDFGALLPLLANGSITPEQFANDLTQRTAEALG